MKILYLEPKDLTRKEVEAFWKQDINMDDWDYLLLLPSCTKMMVIEDMEWCPESYKLQNLLNGYCCNRWYRGKYKGKKYIIGVAYHA